LGGMDVSALAFDPEIPGRIYAGLSAGKGFGGGQAGFLVSSNWGSTWSFHLNSADVLAVVPSRYEVSTVYMATSNGLLRSLDGGRSVQPVAFHDSFINDVAEDPWSPDVLFVISRNSVEKSSDRGGGWKEVLRVPYGDFGRIFSSGRIVYVLGFGNDLYRTEDDGESWTATPTSVDSRTFLGNGGNWAFATSWGVFKSIDQGKTWESSRVGLTALEILALARDQTDGGVLYAACSFSPGEAWLFRTTSEDWEWERLGKLPSPSIMSLIAGSPNRDSLYAASIFDLFRSKDGGHTWKKMGVRSGSLIAALLRTPRNTMYAVGGKGVVRSLDDGDSWESLGLEGHDLGLLAVQPGPPDIIYVGERCYGSEQCNRIFSSKNGGVTWLTSYIGGVKDHIQSIAVNSKDGSAYVVTSAGQIFKTADQGGDWVSVRAEIDVSERFLSSSTLQEGDNSNLYLILDNRIFETKDQGKTWHQVATLPAAVGDLVDIRLKGELFLLIATKGSSVVMVKKP